MYKQNKGNNKPNLHGKSQHLPFFKVVVQFYFLDKIGTEVIVNDFRSAILKNQMKRKHQQTRSKAVYQARSDKLDWQGGWALQMPHVGFNLHGKANGLAFFKVIIHFYFLYEIWIQIVPNNFCTTILENSQLFRSQLCNATVRVGPILQVKHRVQKGNQAYNPAHKHNQTLDGFGGM